MFRIILSLLILFVFSTLALAQIHPDFSGVWLLDPAASELIGGAVGEIRWTVNHNEPEISVKVEVASAEDTRHFAFSCTTDGDECKNILPSLGEVRHTTATWEQDILVMKTNVKSRDGEFHASDHMYLSDDGTKLLFERITRDERGERISKQVFDKLQPVRNAELVGGPCEGCEAVFEYGNGELSPVDTLPGFEKYDPKLKVSGTIYKNDGVTPAEDVILYIYHTNREGVYPTRGDEKGWARHHGYIRGWIKTDADGKYTFYTFKPGSYSSNPAHIHPIILEPNGKYYYIDEYRFKRDPKLKNVKEYIDNRGGSGIVELKKTGNFLVVERDIILGKNISNYE